MPRGPVASAEILPRRGIFPRGVLSAGMLPAGVPLLGMLLLSTLGACSNSGSFSPIDWWHRQEGGKIAEDRPAPPGADEPYPNLNTVPGRPAPPNQDELNKLTAALVADRTNAQHEAQATPMADPSSPSASPGLFGVGTAPPPGAAPPPPANIPSAGNQDAGSPPMASASMPAVTTPPPPATPPAPAPRKAVQSAPLEPPTPVERPAAPSPSAATAAPPPAASSPPIAAMPLVPQAAPADANAQQPTLPSAPPPRPAVAGSAPPPVVTPPPMPESKGAQNATIVFPEGSTTLSQPATAEVKSFAAKRGNGVIVVTGFGEAASADPVAQSAGLNTGLARAIAIATALKEAGVPGPAIRVSAEASGRGASLVLLQ